MNLKALEKATMCMQWAKMKKVSTPDMTMVWLCIFLILLIIGNEGMKFYSHHKAMKKSMHAVFISVLNIGMGKRRIL